MGYYSRLAAENNAGMRLGIVRKLNDIRDKCFRNLEEDPRRREESELEHFWTYSEYHQARQLLAADLEVLARTTPSGKPMMEKYEQMCCDFVSTRHDYVHEPYDEKIARTRMERYRRNLHQSRVESRLISDETTGYTTSRGSIQGPQPTPAPQTDDLPEAMKMMEMAPGLPGSLHTIQYGCKSSPKHFIELITGRVAPPEGNVTGQDAGGAGLPIPEGCSSTEAMKDQDGQSNPGDV